MITAESKGLSERKAIVWTGRAISYLLYAYLIVVEIILVSGFFLLLFGANPTAGFTQWAYRNLERVMEPFRGIFPPIELGTTGNDVPAIFDTSVLFAMIIYGIIALMISVLIGWLSGRLDQIHAAEHELARQAEIAQMQADADARMLAAQQAAAQQAAAQQAAAQQAAAQQAAAQQAAAVAAAQVAAPIPQSPAEPTMPPAPAAPTPPQPTPPSPPQT
jgi:hypothetical protein